MIKPIVKLTLVSVWVRGIRKSAFLMLEYINGKPAINEQLLCELFQIPSGITVTIGG